MNNDNSSKTPDIFEVISGVFTTFILVITILSGGPFIAPLIFIGVVVLSVSLVVWVILLILNALIALLKGKY